jgi:hypothetical protein
VEAKQNAKQRQRLSEKQRVYNRARKSAVATRVKKASFLHPPLCKVELKVFNIQSVRFLTHL